MKTAISFGALATLLVKVGGAKRYGYGRRKPSKFVVGLPPETEAEATMTTTTTTATAIEIYNISTSGIDETKNSGSETETTDIYNISKLDIDETICGNDDRELSSDPRIGRLVPTAGGKCTAWLISNDVIVTAGHCYDDDENERVPYLVEFNVPLSNADGSDNASEPEDRYQVRFDGSDGGITPVEGIDWLNAAIGNDWAVGRLLRNEETGLLAGDSQGCWVNLEFDTPSLGSPVRITGHGTDDEPVKNLVQQTEVGPLVDDDQAESEHVLEYQTDTTGGNSGGPVINDSTGGSYGVHVQGGCSEDAGSNKAMANSQPEFLAALELYLGVDPQTNFACSPVCPYNFDGKPPNPNRSCPVPILSQNNIKCPTSKSSKSGKTKSGKSKRQWKSKSSGKATTSTSNKWNWNCETNSSKPSKNEGDDFKPGKISSIAESDRERIRTGRGGGRKRMREHKLKPP